MALRFLHSVSVQDQAISADGIFTFDLAVNPLSVVCVCLRPLNDTGTLSNSASYRGMCTAINRFSILHRGESIVSCRGEDLAALNYFRHGILPLQATTLDTDNDRRCVMLPCMMGRWAYDPVSCFPASRRGELVLELDLDIADTGYDGLRLSVETVELLGASPKEYEKKVQLTQTWSATGDQDFDLPPGNVNRGLLLFGTTGFVGASPAPSWGRVKVLLDNLEALYAASDFEVAMGLPMLWGRTPPMDVHRHRVDATGGATEQTTAAIQLVGGAGALGGAYTNYAFLDFDPTKDDTYSLDTSGHSRFHLRANAETADAVRVVPIEVIKVAG